MVKTPPAIASDVRGALSIPGLGRSMEEGMATHLSTARRIPWTAEPGGSHRVYRVHRVRQSQRGRHD